MIHADGAIRTDEMSLAVVLSMEGYDLLMVRQGRVVIWVIPENDADESAHEIVHEYVSGAYRVEPRNFMREVREVRTRLYDFLNITAPNKSVRGPVAGRLEPADDAAT